MAHSCGLESVLKCLNIVHCCSLRVCDLCGTVWTGTYLTNEAKGAEDAPDADTAIINAEGNYAHAEEKKEYFI